MDNRLLCEITGEHIRSYDEDGVVVVRGAISMDWVERMRDAMDRVLDQPGPLGSDLNPAGTEGRFAFETFVASHDEDFRALAHESPLAEMSGVSSTSARISSAWASIRCERWSPPCGLGPTSPVRRHRFTHLIAVEAATPKRRAAERRDRPLSTADTSRSRRSLERGFVMQAGLLHQPTS